VLILKDDVAANGVFPSRCALIGNAKPNSSIVNVGEVVGQPLFDSIVVQIGSFALAYRLAVEVNSEPLERPINVVDEFRPR
jgi:hypothetical protein